MEHHLEEFKPEHAIDIDDGQIQHERPLAGDDGQIQQQRQLAGDEGEDQEQRQLAGDVERPLAGDDGQIQHERPLACDDQQQRQLAGDVERPLAGDDGQIQHERPLAGDEGEDQHQEQRQLAGDVEGPPGDDGQIQHERPLAGDEGEDQDQEQRQLAGDVERPLAGDDGQIQHERPLACDEGEDQEQRQLAGDVEGPPGDDGQIQHERPLAGDEGEDQHQEDGKVLHRLCAWRKVGACVQSDSHMPAACWIKNASGWLIAFAGAALTLSYTMVSSPRGGFWQEDLDDGKNSHEAGEPILESKFPHSYDYLMIYGSMSFLTSLFLVLFLIHDVFYRTPWRMSVLVLTALFNVGCLIGAFIYGQFPQYPSSGAADMSLALLVIAVFIVGNIILWGIYKLLCYVRNRVKQRTG